MMGCERHEKETGRLRQNGDLLGTQERASGMRGCVASFKSNAPRKTSWGYESQYMFVTFTMSYNMFMNRRVGATGRVPERWHVNVVSKALEDPYRRIR